MGHWIVKNNTISNLLFFFFQHWWCVIWLSDSYGNTIQHLVKSSPTYLYRMCWFSWNTNNITLPKLYGTQLTTMAKYVQNTSVFVQYKPVCTWNRIYVKDSTVRKLSQPLIGHQNVLFHIQWIQYSVICRTGCSWKLKYT